MTEEKGIEKKRKKQENNIVALEVCIFFGFPMMSSSPTS